MKLTKKSGGIAAAVVLAAGVTVASTTTAFADSSGKTKAVAAAKAGAKGKAGAKKATGVKAGALFLRGAHGDRTVRDKDGAWVTREWQVGKVSAVDGQTVTVVGAEGTTWTWTAGTATKVRSEGAKAELGSVKAGDEVLVSGVKSSSAHEAKAIVDPGQALLQTWEQAAKDAQAKRAAKK